MAHSLPSKKILCTQCAKDEKSPRYHLASGAQSSAIRLSFNQLNSEATFRSHCLRHLSATDATLCTGFSAYSSSSTFYAITLLL